MTKLKDASRYVILSEAKIPQTTRLASLLGIDIYRHRHILGHW